MLQKWNMDQKKIMPLVKVILLLILLSLLGVLTFLGYYQIGRRLVSTEASLQFIPRLITGGSAAIEKENTTPEEVGVVKYEEVPEGVMETWNGEERVTVLVMGLDYRDWSSGAGPSRTDTMMLLTMDPLSNQAGILSIPRDLWVSIPGFENNRINVAYFLGEVYDVPGGGPAMAVRAVEGLLGIRINYFAVVDFGAFVRFVDELGGVKVDVPGAIRIDPIVGNPKILQPGIQTLPGELALAYARARNTPNGDLDRAIRQQQVVYGIRDRLLNPDSLTELITKAPVLMAEISSGVRTNLDLDEAIKLAWLAQKVPDEWILTRAISPQDVSYARTPDGRSILLPKTERIRQLRDEIFLGSAGTLGPLSPGDPLENAVMEGANIRIINGTGDESLGQIVEDILISQGFLVHEFVSGEISNQSSVIDFSGNPHTMKYFIGTLGLSPGNYDFNYDSINQIDFEIMIGMDTISNFVAP
jgi:LCP family protein required for cell wall assembly